MRFLIFLSTTLLVCSDHSRCNARDTITAASPLSNGETVVSAGKRFELGFFQPEGNNGGKHVGIWYYKPDPQTVVWIANRDKPLLDSTGAVFTIAEDGNLQVVDGKGAPCFSTQLERPTISNRSAKLLDSGNLVLVDNQLGTHLWQSFQNPTDTFLPGMRMNGELNLTSWITPSNPRSGSYTFQQDEENEDIYNIKNGTIFYWRSGEASKLLRINDMPSQISYLLTNFSRSVEETSYQSPTKPHINFPAVNHTYQCNDTRLLLNSSGALQYYIWDGGRNRWSLLWSEPNDACSVYNKCGTFGYCSKIYGQPCQCFTGYEPSRPESWNAGDFSDGCKMPSESDPCHNTEKQTRFQNLTLRRVGIPEQRLRESDTEANCKAECVRDCRCQAYSFTRIGNTSERETRTGYGCLIWKTDLKNLQESDTDTDKGINISVREPVTSKVVGQANPVEERPPKTSSTIEVKTVVIVTMAIAAALVLCSLGYIFYKRKISAERRASVESNPRNPFPYVHITDERQTTDFIDEEDSKGTNVSFFKLESILAATENFSDANKLGEGGFGPVYRGTFFGGQDIAVKRLSSHSGQGMEEFRNEVVLIAKLQHRNLVRLLGYCVEGNEKILLYEYMPNKSLDAFIFDEKLCILLDWKKRFDIILGIARGLLYLHQDSRLRIIHRDLKTSNILLDEEMNPKVSDFGLARIVEGKQTEVNTNRVVGTYGYMSPEYALEGLFSVKSDVFSFGVIVLEIVSGKRTTGSYQSKEALNLLGYAWRLWKEEKALDLLDHTLLESCNKSEVLKCINIGLLCVQEDPNDRPTMSNVVFMLGSESATIPSPNQPAYVLSKRLLSTSSSSSSKPEAFSENKLTISMQEGR